MTELAEHFLKCSVFDLFEGAANMLIEFYFACTRTTFKTPNSTPSPLSKNSDSTGLSARFKIRPNRLTNTIVIIKHNEKEMGLANAVPVSQREIRSENL